MWDRDFTWAARRVASPHAFFEYQTLLGSLAARAGRLQLGVGVTEPIRRHPVLIAQAALTLAHLTKRAPILRIGTGERMNTEPYGFSGAHAVDRFAEAVQIIRRCFTSHGPIDFAGKHFRLDRAVMDLQPPPGRTPEIWIAAHGPRMLGLTGRYGDGWLPNMSGVNSPEDYRSKLAQIRAAATDAGRDPAAITPALFAYIAVAPSGKKVGALLTSRSLRYFALLLPADRWREMGAEHPFGAQCRGMVGYGSRNPRPGHAGRRDRHGATRGDPQRLPRRHTKQVTARLRQFGDPGMRHVVLLRLSAVITMRDFVYAGWAVRMIARTLRAG